MALLSAVSDQSFMLTNSTLIRAGRASGTVVASKLIENSN